MPTLTQAPSQGDVVKFQIDPNYTNEAITLLLGANYKSGSVLVKSPPPANTNWPPPPELMARRSPRQSC